MVAPTGILVTWAAAGGLLKSEMNRELGNSLHSLCWFSDAGPRRQRGGLGEDKGVEPSLGRCSLFQPYTLQNNSLTLGVGVGIFDVGGDIGTARGVSGTAIWDTSSPVGGLLAVARVWMT